MRRPPPNYPGALRRKFVEFLKTSPAQHYTTAPPNPSEATRFAMVYPLMKEPT
jgi:hypothetical protein